jgi:hypothetical protein
MTVPVLSDFSLQYGTSGLLLNGLPLSDGTIIDVDQVDGLDEAPVKSSEASYEGRDGGILNAFFSDMRKPKITGTIYGGTNSVFNTIDLLKANFAVGLQAQPLFFQQAGQTPRQLFCKSLGFNYSWTAAMRLNNTPFTINLQAEDPTIYGTTNYMPVGYFQTLGSQPGYHWSRAWSYSWGGGNPIGQTLLVNNGNKAVGFLATIQGQACNNPTLISDTTGLNIATNIIIGATDVLTFDFYQKSLFLNGVSKHAAITNEGWFQLQPGLNSIRLQVASVTAAQILFNFYDGWR